MASRLRVTYAPPTPLTADLRSSLMSALLSTSVVSDLHAVLLSSCQSTGWLNSVRERAVQLLRNGDCSTYDQVMAVIIAESKGNQENCSEEERLQKDGASVMLAIDGQEILDGDQGKQDLEGYKKGLNDGRRELKRIDVKIPESIITGGQTLVKLALGQVVKVVEEENVYLT